MKGFTLNKKFDEYKEVCNRIMKLEEQRPNQFEMFEDKDFEKLEQINEQIKPLEEERKQIKTWFIGYMSAYIDMHDMDTMNEIEDILSNIEHGREN